MIEQKIVRILKHSGVIAVIMFGLTKQKSHMRLLTYWRMMKSIAEG